MIKSMRLLVILAALPTAASAYSPDTGEETIQCRHLSQTLGLTDDQRYVNDLVFEIAKYGDLQPAFVLCEVIGDSVIATSLLREGERAVVYNQAVFTGLRLSGETSSGALFILAHEVGHHLLGHISIDDSSYQSNPTVSDIGSRSHKRELQADEFAGFVLSKMGAALNDASHAVGQVNESPTLTHPSRADRIEAVHTGWKKARMGKLWGDPLTAWDEFRSIGLSTLGFFNSTLGFVATLGGAIGAVSAFRIWLRRKRRATTSETEQPGTNP